MKNYIYSLALLVLFSSSLYAQTKTSDSTKVEQLDEIVITAQFAPTTEKNAIYRVKTINLETIQTKAAVNLTDVLRNELNVDLSFNAVFGAGIELNGVSKENIKILIDGVPVIGRVNGVLNLNQINVDNIERIEIIEGPVSVFYGTDAMGGTINFITKKEQEKPVTGSLSTYYEGVEAKNIDGSLGYKFGKNILRAEGGYYYFNGINTDDELERTQNWPKKNQYHVNAKYIRELGDFKLVFSSNFSEEEVNTLGEISSRTSNATDIDYTTKRWDNSLNFQGKLKNQNYLDATVSYLDYDRFDTSYIFDPATNSSVLIQDNPNENANYFNTFFSKVQYANSNLDNKLNYVLGLEFQSDYAKGNRILDGKKDVSNASLYGSVNYKVTDKLVIQPALRYTYNSTFKGLLSPAFNLKYKFDNQNVLRFAYGNGYRAPSIKELYLDWMPTFGPFTYTFTGNEDLKVESSHNFNLYYTFTQHINNSSYIQIEPSFIFNKIENLIGLSELIAFERHYVNLNKTKSLNAAVDVKYTASDDLKLSLGLSYLGRYFEYTDTFNSDTFLYTPYVNASITYNYKPFDLGFNAFYKYSGKRKGHYIEDEGGIDVLKESTREDFSNLELSLTKTFLDNKLSVSLGGKNLFDVTDIDTFNQIGSAHKRNIQFWGATYYLQTRLNF